MSDSTNSNEVMLTTVDNPYDPFSQFDSWFRFDTEKGYNTCSYLARITNIPEDATQEEANREVERAVDEIILYNPLDIYRKVVRKDLILREL